MTIKELRQQAGLTKTEFSEKYKIPLRTLEHWELGDRLPPDYVVDMIKKIIEYERNLKNVL